MKTFDFARVLDDVLARAKARWSQKDRDRAVQIGVDLADLMARQALGEDVSAELKIAKASVKNLQASSALTGAAAITAGLQQFLQRFLQSALLV